ncbi:hypothetical protein [Microbispora sp. NPDC046933]|uniref:trypsin-like serine peptidase n=1 Tax=Microbispora sp. NPDC046933 TaxID=3155618 RepID=UPI0033E57B1B
MKRTLALGGVAAGLLASAVVASPAHAEKIPAKPLAETNFAAKQVAAFWFGEKMANLIHATPYNVETKVSSKVVAHMPKAPTSKPGVVGSSAEQKPTGTSKNVNLPRSSGKVFFVGADNKPHWCSATAVQSLHKNLVATAGHCVFDTVKGKTTMNKWVFIPGYYEGKAPWGIYVGKIAFTHSDYDAFADGDHNYAFVAVYKGIQVTDVKTDKVKNWVDNRIFKTRAEAEKAQQEVETKTTGWAGRIVPFVSTPETVVRDKKNKEYQQTWIDVSTWAYWQNTEAPALADDKKAPTLKEALELLNKGRGQTTDFKTAPGTGIKVTRVSLTDYNSAKDEVKIGDVEFRVSEDKKSVYFVYDHGYYKANFWAKYDLDYKLTGKIVEITLKDVGRLGDNVSGQGLAYNQKVGQPTYVFGYPSGAHKDGNFAFTGKTLKWTYGKTFPAEAPSIKGEALQGIKSSFTGEGALGSGWLFKYNNSKRFGYLNGVTISVSDTDGNDRYDTSLSPYFDGETYEVYKAAAATDSGSII